jgi:hypothetical protein
MSNSFCSKKTKQVQTTGARGWDPSFEPLPPFFVKKKFPVLFFLFGIFDFVINFFFGYGKPSTY